jgi:hypothetical protein
MIYAQGINPDGTPTARKLAMLANLRWMVIAAFLVFLCSTVLILVQVVQYWVATFIVMLVDLAVYCGMCYLCRIRSEMAAVCGEEQEAYTYTAGNVATPPEGRVFVVSGPCTGPGLRAERGAARRIHAVADVIRVNSSKVLKLQPCFR